MRPHADGMTGETREMQEMRRLPDSYSLTASGFRGGFLIKGVTSMLGTIVFSFLMMFIFFVFAPELWWLGGVIAVLLIVLWKILTRNADEKKPKDDVPRTEYDEFDWWQDNQGF